MANAVVKFHREQQGRGPTDVRVALLGDMVIVRYFGIFTPTESNLSRTEEGRRLIRSARQELRQIARDDIHNLVSSLVGCAVLRSYYDISVDAAEQVEIFVLEVDLEKKLVRAQLDRLSGLSPGPQERANRR